MEYILAINPGSTTTKIAIYQGKVESFSKTLAHSAEEIAQYKDVISQYQFRKDTIEAALRENNISLADITIIVGRGGLLKPISAGVYEVNEEMIKDLSSAQYGEHASNLGGIIADAMAKEINALTGAKSCRAFIADPPVVDEMQEVARISGHPLFPRKSVFHALNQRATAKLYAADCGKRYDELNLIVAHLGGGVTVGAHCKGRIIDVNDGLNGEGPFSPERSGGITAMYLAKLCFSGKYTFPEVKKMISGKGGVVAHLGTNSFIEVLKKAEEGDAKAKLVADAFTYNVAKQVGAMATVLKGQVDAILITGGIAHSKVLMQQLIDSLSFIAPVKIYPGEDEMGALASNGLAVLNGTEEVKKY